MDKGEVEFLHRHIRCLLPRLLVERVVPMVTDIIQHSSPELTERDFHRVVTTVFTDEILFKRLQLELLKEENWKFEKVEKEGDDNG
jgi:hypothetical protein